MSRRFGLDSHWRLASTDQCPSMPKSRPSFPAARRRGSLVRGKTSDPSLVRLSSFVVLLLTPVRLVK